MLGGEYMANTNTATLFGPDGIMSPTSDRILGFCHPIFEGIFLFSSELASSMDRPPYFGDRISLGFWGKLGINFGSPELEKIKVVCIGGTLTAINWVSLWADLIGANVVNKGIVNDTSVNMLTRFQQDVIDLQPDYCIIECGFDDYIGGISLQSCKDNIDAMVALCLANNIEPRFVHYIQRNNQLQLAIAYEGYSFDIDSIKQYLSDIWEYESSLGYKCILFNNSTDVDDNNAGMQYFYNSTINYIQPNSDGCYQWAVQLHIAFIDISSSHDTQNLVYTLHEGWKYKYYYNQKRFVVQDENENVIYDKDNVTVISQFPIDFKIHKTHQFEIIINDASTMSTFYVPAELVKKVYGDSPIVNNGNISVINNNYLPNTEFSNYLDIWHLSKLSDSYMKYNINPKYDLVKYPSTIGGTQGNIDMNKIMPTSRVYGDSFIPSYAVKVPITFRAQLLEYRMVLAILGLTMFPMLESILRPDEEQNNRPIYEPWLIWGVYKFLGNHEYDWPWDDEDAPNIDVLDGISPNWSY
jgi:hypothetical protein